jgi:hypothetical protein
MIWKPKRIRLKEVEAEEQLNQSKGERGRVERIVREVTTRAPENHFTERVAKALRGAV